MTEPNAAGLDDLWTCPRCGHRFVTANLWHSCTTIDLDTAFARSLPVVRQSFDRYVELIARCGPITVIAQKTRLVVMARVRFAGAVVRHDRLIANFALTRRLDDPRFRIATYGERWNAHRFGVRSPDDLAIPGLPDWLCESYRELGMQGALRAPRRAVGGVRRATRLTSAARGRPVASVGQVGGPPRSTNAQPSA